jgi:hypothetical protein
MPELGACVPQPDRAAQAPRCELKPCQRVDRDVIRVREPTDLDGDQIDLTGCQQQPQSLAETRDGAPRDRFPQVQDDRPRPARGP